MDKNKKEVMTEKTDGFGIPGKNLLQEMAKVGNKDGYIFRVYKEPFGNPSFHLEYKNDFEIVLQIKDLKILEIKFNNSHFKFKKNENIPGEIKKVVLDFLDEINSIDPTKTNGEFLDVLWRALNQE